LGQKRDAGAIKRFSTFLEQRNCCFWLENELKEVLPVRKKKPDFFVRTQSRISVLVEVESFEKGRSALDALRRNSVMTGLHWSDSRRFSSRISSAADQLGPYRDLRNPGLVVLDDFRGVGMPVNVDVLGLMLVNYFRAAHRPYLSAVSWLLEKEDRRYFLRSFHNPHAQVPLVKHAFGIDEDWLLPDGQFWKRCA
jgi:hypothetical protein